MCLQLFIFLLSNYIRGLVNLSKIIQKLYWCSYKNFDEMQNKTNLLSTRHAKKSKRGFMINNLLTITIYRLFQSIFTQEFHTKLKRIKEHAKLKIRPCNTSFTEKKYLDWILKNSIKQKYLQTRENIDTNTSHRHTHRQINDNKSFNLINKVFMLLCL